MTMTAPRRLTLVAASWEPDAACLRWPDPEDFFPDRGDEDPAVLRVCHGCRVMRQCGEAALRNRERYGVWGGMTELERERWWTLARRRISAGAIPGVTDAGTPSRSATSRLRGA
jgi:WhiB family redox-sensing transcriptional regulator